MAKCHLDEPLPLGVGDSPTLSHSIHALTSTQIKRPLQRDVTRTVDSISFHAQYPTGVIGFHDSITGVLNSRLALNSWRYPSPKIAFISASVTAVLFTIPGSYDGKIARRASRLGCIACRFHFSRLHNECLRITAFPILSFVFLPPPKSWTCGF